MARKLKVSEIKPIETLDIGNGRHIVLKSTLDQYYCWTHVFLTEGEQETHVGFYGNSLDGKMKESIKYNENFIVFYYRNPYVPRRDPYFIKKIYDINNQECLGYNEYPEFVEQYDSSLKRARKI